MERVQAGHLRLVEKDLVGQASSMSHVDVHGGRMRINRLEDGTRIVSTDDDLRHRIIDRLGNSDEEGQWTLDQEQCFALIHHLRRKGEGMPERGDCGPPGERTYFKLTTTWGRYTVHHQTWGSFSFIPDKGADREGLRAYAKKIGAKWSERHGNWNLTKRQFDNLVLLHWRDPNAADPGRLLVVGAKRDHADGRLVMTTDIAGHPYVLDHGRGGPKVDRDWYRRTGRWHSMRTSIGEYQVFDLHDDWKAIFVLAPRLHVLLKEIGATRSEPVNGYLLSPSALRDFHGAISRASGHGGDQMTLI